MWKVKPAPDSVWPKPICVCHFWAKVLLSLWPGIPRGDVLASPQHRDAPAGSVLSPWTPTCPSPLLHWIVKLQAEWFGLGSFRQNKTILERSVCRGLRMSEVCLLHTGVFRASVAIAQGRLQEFLCLLGSCWGCSMLSLPAPSFPDPPGNEQGSSEDKLSLAGDGVKWSRSWVFLNRR